jgi:F0F1-type ATP synthase delta subunit
MKHNRRLEKLIHNIVAVCFDKTGKVNDKKVEEFTTDLSKLTPPENIEALHLFVKELKRKVEETTLVIESADTLSDKDTKEIANSFKSHTISKVEVKMNPQLIGGLRVRLGNTIFDDSIENRIQQLGGAIKG